MAIVAVSLVALIAMAALSIDLGTLYQAKTEAQRAADEAALAAARTISMEGLTGDPTNASGFWSQICGGPSSLATLAANTVVQQNLVAGVPPPLPLVTFSAPGGGAPNQDCTLLGAAGGAFGVNPQVTVLVQRSNLPIFFARVFSLLGGNYFNTSVGATATAEVFNPSNSATYVGNVIPVQPRCVKPFIVPNYDPYLGCNSSAGACPQFVNPANGNLGRAGISAQSGGGGGVIGERFWLLADCRTTGSTCTLQGSGQPQANYSGSPYVGANIQYVPGQTSFQSIAITADGSAACSAVTGNYAQAIAGCDQSTQYQCGVPASSATNPYQVNLSENPVATGDTTNGVQCLIHENSIDLTQTEGQDLLLPQGTFATGSLPPDYPFQIQVGSHSPLLNATPPVPSTGLITASSSIISLPIYDSPPGVNTINPTGPTNVTIVGFLQVFINVVDANGNVYVTVLNVSGCGNGTTPVSSYPLYGTSPVPVRLITPP
jgi:hypothetical protein